MNKKESFNINKTFKEGVGGGILGAFVGLPGLGMVIGVAHANKHILKPINDLSYKYKKKNN